MKREHIGSNFDDFLNSTRDDVFVAAITSQTAGFVLSRGHRGA